MGSDKWKIVGAGRSDAAAMARLWAALMAEEAPPLVSVGASGEEKAEMAFDRILDQRDRYRAFIGLVRDDRGTFSPGGFILGSSYGRLYGEPSRVGHILHWYLRPELRGQGMGRDLYRTLMLWFEEERVEILEVLARKEPSRTKAWTGLGFSPVLDLFMMRPPWKTG